MKYTLSIAIEIAICYVLIRVHLFKIEQKIKTQKSKDSEQDN